MLSLPFLFVLFDTSCVFFLYPYCILNYSLPIEQAWGRGSGDEAELVPEAANEGVQHTDGFERTGDDCCTEGDHWWEGIRVFWHAVAWWDTVLPLKLQINKLSAFFFYSSLSISQHLTKFIWFMLLATYVTITIETVTAQNT